ncbi:MAG: HEPN domain-containing protein [Armatimonadota bacterium]|nr:HEPN domain-containing protein [Armatimonadota bacterium]
MRDPELIAEAGRWLRFAREDLVTAEGLRRTQGRFIPRHVCWLAQQAAEKALKAALILEGVDFPFRHDLDALRNLLPEGWSVKDEHPDLTELTEWAVEARYPGDWPDPTVKDADRALAQARGVLESVVRDCAKRGVQQEG